MKTLLSFELKKILRRKSLWLMLLVGLVLWMLPYGIGIVKEGLNGYARTVKDVYRRYEGQVITEAFQAQAQRDFESYIAAHASSFKLETVSEGEPGEFTMYMPTDVSTPYDNGVWAAYSDLTRGMSLEDEQKIIQDDRDMLSAGVDNRGNPLTDEYRASLQEAIQRGVKAPVVHDVFGWVKFYENYGQSILGMMTMALLGMALLGLFNGEASTRMEDILLTSRARGRVAAAKLLAAVLVALVGGLLLTGLAFAVVAFSWGLDGALLPMSALENYYYGTTPILAVFGLTVPVLGLAALTCAAVVAWASARFRHVLATMLVAGGILGGTLALYNESKNAFGFADTFMGRVNEALSLLPMRTLTDMYELPGRLCDGQTLALLLALPAALTAVLFWLACRAFLKRRKA